MKGSWRSFAIIGLVFLIALVFYIFTTPHGKDIPLTGIVDGNEVIVSPQIMGRIITLKVDEGSEVRKGDLIAELDPKELEASLAAAKANVASLQAQVNEANHNYSLTDDSTVASLKQAQATLTSTRAQLDQAKANLWRDQTDYDRVQRLFDSGVESAQDRDHAEATLRASQANVKSLEDSVGAQKSRRRSRSSSRRVLPRPRRQHSSATREFTRRSMESFRCASRSKEKWFHRARRL
jgi:multidrug resistance efflux pump